MSKKREGKKRRGRYDVSGNLEAEYVDAEKTVLVNKPGITDLDTLQVAEEEALAAAYETLLGEVRMDTPMTLAAKAAFKKEYGRMEAIIRSALERAQKTG